jgi:hypothetical protein
MMSPVIQRASCEARNANRADIIGLADPLERLHTENEGLALVWRAREGECELGTLAIGKRCQERISATGWAW